MVSCDPSFVLEIDCIYVKLMAKCSLRFKLKVMVRLQDFRLLGNITHRGSNSEVHLHTPQQKVPFSLIRCSSSNAKDAYCSCVAWGLRIYNIVESESDPLTRRPVNLFEKEPLKGNSEVHLHTPTKFGEDPSKDLGGDREHTHKRCSNYSMI